MKREVTLAGYMALHERAAAFTGADGQAYSCAIYVDDTPDGQGLYAAALLFVRWDEAGQRPVGHVETGPLAVGPTPQEAEERLGNWSLFDVKAALDDAIRAQPPAW